MKTLLFVGVISSVINCLLQIYFAVDQKYTLGYIGALGWALVSMYQTIYLYGLLTIR